MNGIDKYAVFYRGYLPDDRSLIPSTIELTTIVAVWLLTYLFSAVDPLPALHTAQPPAHPTTATDSSTC